MRWESRFDLASVGKTFTGACCAFLWLQGKLDLDAPFTEYLPEHVLGASCDITVRDLATHSSGFSNEKPYQLQDWMAFEEALMRFRPVRRRGEAFEYSCYNLILLGKIVERLSEMGLEDAAREWLWKPLGMNHTQWLPPGPGEYEVKHWDPNRPAGQHNDASCFFHVTPLGNGSCFSTAEDMLAFVDDIAREGHFPADYYRLLHICTYEKDGARRGFTWDMSPGSLPVGFSDQGVIHTGFTGQTICADPRTGFAAVVLTSRTGDWGEARRRRREVIEALMQEAGESA